MEMNRRQVLGVIGTFLAAPMLLVDKPKKKIVRLDEEIIPTGFPTIDMALGGGLRRGTIHVIMGFQGSGKTALMRSIALHAAKTSSVGFVPEEDMHMLTLAGEKKPLTNVVAPFEGNLWYHNPVRVGYYDGWKALLEKHDILFDESFCNQARYYELGGSCALAFHNLAWAVAQIARSQNCAVVISLTTRPTIALPPHSLPTSLAYQAATILKMEHFHHQQGDNKYWHALIENRRYVPMFDCEVVKNRWGRTVHEIMYLNTQTFRMYPWGVKPESLMVSYHA